MSQTILKMMMVKKQITRVIDGSEVLTIFRSFTFFELNRLTDNHEIMTFKMNVMLWMHFCSLLMWKRKKKKQKTENRNYIGRRDAIQIFIKIKKWKKCCRTKSIWLKKGKRTFIYASYSERNNLHCRFSNLCLTNCVFVLQWLHSSNG